MNTWRRCEFDPLDVIVSADGRPLESSYGFDGPLTPAPFSGAVRTAMLRAQGLTDPRASDANGVRDALGIPHRGPASQSATFRIAGAWPRSESREPLLPAPAFLLRDPFGLLLPRTIASAVLWNHSQDLPCLLGADGPERGRIEDRLLPIARLCEVLRDVQRIPPRLLRNLVQSPVRNERRFGHRRAATGAPEDHALFSRGVLRPEERVRGGRPYIAGWVAYIRGVDAMLPANGALLRVGGDGRRVSFRQSAPDLEPVEELGRRVAEAVTNGSDEVLLYLATPAVFSEGWRPSGLAGLELVSAAVEPPFALSGWDYHFARPKPQRLAVRAGSVYFFRVTDKEKARETLKRLHFNDSLCDDPADGLSGFGMCLAGLWGSSAEKRE